MDDVEVIEVLCGFFPAGSPDTFGLLVSSVHLTLDT
jgi:hypothetical protein